MPPVNRRPAAPSRSSSSSRRTSAPAASSGYRGAAARERAEAVQAQNEAAREQRQQQGLMPFRFFIPPGESREIIVMDEEPDFFRWEHTLRGPDGRFNLHVPCIQENDNCPACEEHPNNPAYFGMFLTIVDTTPYVNRDDVEIPWSKKLLVVKPAQQKKITRLFERHGTLRGMVLSMTRDGERDASIGNDIEFIEILDEDALQEYVTEYEDKDRKKHEILGYEPYDYDALFPAMDAEQIAALVGGNVNSRERHERNLRDDDRRSSRPASRPASRAGAPSRGTSSRPAARGRGREEEDPIDGEEPDERPASRAASRSAARPAARPAARGRGDSDDDAPQRPAARSAARPAARGREEPQDDDGAEEAPVRPSMAERRRQLRGGSR